MTKKRYTVSTNSRGMKRIVAALEKHGPMGADALADAAFVAKDTIKNHQYVRILIAAELIHIGGWMRGRSGHPKPIYHAGPGNPAPRPERKTKDEERARARNWKERTCYHAAEKAKRRVARVAENPMLALLRVPT